MRTLLSSFCAQLGAVAAGLGLVTLVFAIYDWRAQSGAHSPLILWISAAATIGSWAALRSSSNRQPVGERSSTRRSTETGLFASGLLFLVLSVIAPKVVGHPTVETSAVGAMRSDLRNLWTAEDRFFTDSGKYTATLGGDRYGVSSAVRGPAITLTADGWTASVTHERSPRTCVIFAGTTPDPPAERAGEPACTSLPPPAFLSAIFQAGLALLAAGLLLAAAGYALGTRQPGGRISG